MKKKLKLLFIIICTFSTTVQSQAVFTGLKKDYTQSIDSIITYVNKTPITTGILYDRVMSFSNLNMLKENGVVTKSNYENFIQSWSELYRSAYTPTFLSLETLKSNINTNTDPNLVDIGIINTKMNYIDYGTPTNPSLTTIGGYLYNVNGINPFLEKQITIISPLKEKINSGTVTFRLLSSFLLQLTGLPIKNLVADFGTGASYNLITNSVISTTNPTITYTTSGKKDFIFTVTFNDNTTEILEATMDIVFSNSSTAKLTVSGFPLEEDFVNNAGITSSTPGNIAFQGYNETSATKGTLEYRTYYNLVTNNGSIAPKINKPIIILDGYDPGDGRKIYNGSIGYDPDKKSLYELMTYDPDNSLFTDNNINLVDLLRSAPYGFDVILVNFQNGADYVERNAMALVALLNRENQKLIANGSTEKISIIGPSMGGLVSRYALAYMEKNGLNHNTKLWVSFDSPHLGANIPIGAQENLYFYGYKGRQDQAKIKFDENFRSPAARQMLIEQLDGKHETSPYPTDLWRTENPNGQNNNSPFRQQFQANLNSNGLNGSNGYPQNLRKIALINGTTNGATTNNAGNKFLELAAFTIIKYGQIFGTSIQTKIKVASIDDSFLQNSGSLGQTFSGKVTIKRTGGLEVQNGSISRTNTNPRGSMDNVQGGTFNTQGIIKDEFTLALNDAVDSQEWRTYLPNHAFIPSVSALAFKNPNFDWSTAMNRNLVCDPINKEIYFDSYFAPSTNQEHVFVSAENANWLIKELQGIPQAPYFPLQENLLAGPAAICSTTTFAFSDICKIPSTATWTVNSNLQIVSSTDYSITVNQITSGEGIITATFQNGQTITKNLAPDINIVTAEEDDVCMQYYNYDGMVVYGAPNGVHFSGFNSSIPSQDNLIYYIPNGLTLDGLGHKYLFNIPRTLMGEQIFYNITYTNKCGEQITKLGDIPIVTYECSNNLRAAATATSDTFTIYPNPSSTTINVALMNENKAPAKKTLITGKLYDLNNNEKRKVIIKDNNAQIDASGLNRGVYILKIDMDGKSESHQVIVK